MKIVHYGKLGKPEHQYAWRYMNLHRFIDMIETKCIVFSRMDKFEDPLEGAYPILKNQYIINFENVEIGKGTIDLSNTFDNSNHIRDWRKSHYVSCWYTSKKENWAMWSLYSDEDSVAIRVDLMQFFTHVESAIDTFSNMNSVKDNYCGFTRYVDLSGNLDNINARTNRIALIKDDSYSHEKEFRFVFVLKEETKLPLYKIQLQSFNELLIDVRCHPKMDEWKKWNIKKLLLRRNFDTPVIDSEIFTK